MKYLLTVSAILLFALTGFSQDHNAEIEVEQKINDLFMAMKTSDSIMINTIFTEDVTLKSTFTTKDGQTMIHQGNVKEFIDAVSKPKTDIWDERISNLTILVDDNLALAWMNYSFFLNDKFSHCGVNAIELVKFDNGWRITNLTDTRRKESCE
ncbi:MAG: nuclear transport factor 2 family protein [Crocinitomicaceae bacterium]